MKPACGEKSLARESSLNKSSIGVEIVNPGTVKMSVGQRWVPYQTAQIDLIVKLAQDVIARHNIAPQNVVGHSDIAPQRKLDPARCSRGNIWQNAGRRLAGCF